MESSNQFLGTERIGKLMQKYAIPCIISLLVGALYNIVDQIFIANASYLGSYGNAANTVVFPLTVVALAIAVMVGDDLMFSGVPGIGQLIEVAMAEKMPVIGVMEVPWEKVSRYGIIDGEEVAPGVYRVRDMVEKPKREDAPSRMAIVGRYVLTPDIFDYLEKVKPGHGGEIQLTDALQAMAKDRGMMAVRMAGMRFDAGDWAEFLSANIYFALQDESLRYELLGLLKNFVQFK